MKIRVQNLKLQTNVDEELNVRPPNVASTNVANFGWKIVIESEGLVACSRVLPILQIRPPSLEAFRFLARFRSLSQFSKRLFATIACRWCRYSQQRDMGSSLDSSVRDSATGRPLSPFDFAESGGYSRREVEAICQAVDDVSDDLRPFVAPEHLPALAPQAPEATGPSGLPGPLPGSSRLDKLYEPDFQRLVCALEVFKAQQLVGPELPKVLEGNVSTQIHVPSSVTEGFVPALDVLDVNAEGGVVCGSVLVERKAGVRK